MKKNIIGKKKSHAFGKDVYLLFESEDGTKHWLEAPSWDCGWYWGFGYIETYTNNNNPHLSKDINSHTHVSGLVHTEVNGKYIHCLYENEDVVKTVFTESEGWELSELFKQFYLLKDMSDYCHKPIPGTNISLSLVDNSKSVTGWYDKINSVMIPKITARILEILTP